MADGYWRYADGRTQASLHAPPAAPVKRARPDYPDISGAPEYSGYLPRDEERMGRHVIRDTESIGASYDRYLRSGISSFGGGESGRSLGGGMTSHTVEDPRLMGVGGVDGRNAGYSGGGVDARSMGFGGGRPEIPLPPDASNTLFVEGLPPDCTRREVSHIFRPFVGFQEVRLVSKESRHPGGDPLILCFVDFSNASQSVVALDALQGYKFDEHDRDSANLRLQFARFPGPRSAGGPRGRR